MAAYYENEDFNQLLRNYQQQLTDTSLLFPCFGLECLRNFSRGDACYYYRVTRATTEKNLSITGENR
ncbi:MAG: hypothetical protein GDA48_00185 [Hormoscilla sp. GM102CHS1]|nr:hypothetical protein [Hormoscilla sp. GM102CHS1]